MLSEFAKELRRILVASGFSTKEWATILSVTETTVNRWMRDESFPTAESLRRIMRTLEEHTNTQILYAEFGLLARKPFHKLSPIATGDYGTLAHYMVRPIREAFLGVLDTLKAEDQEEILIQASALARQKRDA
jgi:transcriptional regulator with XRE-family HTH domain